MDRLTPEKRSWLMSRVRSKDTTPELAVRSIAHRLGYRFRLHRKSLPGKPDLVFPSRRRVIFVNGCFWHGHPCKRGKLPKTRVRFWSNKIRTNRARDARNLSALKALGWRTLVVWECDTKRQNALARRINRFLSS